MAVRVQFGRMKRADKSSPYIKTAEVWRRAGNGKAYEGIGYVAKLRSNGGWVYRWIRDGAIICNYGEFPDAIIAKRWVRNHYRNGGQSA